MLRRILPLVMLSAVLACDTSVTNPGPLHDDDLDRPEAHEALVNGMGRALSRALGYVSLTGGITSFEIAPSSSVQSVTQFGITIRQRQGILDPGLSETDVHWQYAQQARWVAEDGVRRFRQVMGEGFATSPLAAEALLHAGYANRLLGENMCQAVIDGGPILPRQVSFERAEAAFTEALAIGQGLGDAAISQAALAGRASVRAWLGNWPGAAADAQAVPAGFVRQAVYSAVEIDQYNRFYWTIANQPLRVHTVASTFYESYFTETGDPRTPWDRDPQFPVGDEGLPWLFQTKYASRDAPIRLSSGREMRLIVAEAQLRSGDLQGSLEILNGLRAEVGVAPWEADGTVEVWTALKRERGIELWLEGRRLWDLQRWLTEGAPGAAEDMTGRSTCFPIGQTEVDTNPNL
jgi:hypothetical protein